MGISRKEQIEKLDEKLAVLTARKRELQAKEKEQARKLRTKRLIQVGAIVESSLGIEMDEETRELFSRFMKNNSEKILQMMSKNASK